MKALKDIVKRLHRLIHNNIGCVCKGNCVEEVKKKKTKRKSK